MSNPSLEHCEWELKQAYAQIETLKYVLQKADALAFQSAAYLNLDKERQEYQEVRRQVIGVPRLGVNAVK